MTDTLTRPGHLSNSQFSSYSDCGEKWRLRYLTDAPRQPQGALIAGIAVHDTIEHAYREGWHEAPYDHQDELVGYFSDLIQTGVTEAHEDPTAIIRWGGRKSKAWPMGEDLDWWLQSGPVMLQRWADVVLHDAEVGNQVWSTDAEPVAGIELSVTVPIPGLDIPVTGRIDALMIDANGQPFVRDWTTGKPGGKTPLQGGLYSWCLAEADGFGMEVERVEYAYLKGADMDAVLQSFDPRPFQAAAIQNFVMMDAAVNAGVFMLRPSSFCSSCEVKSSCDYGKTL